MNVAAGGVVRRCGIERLSGCSVRTDGDEAGRDMAACTAERPASIGSPDVAWGFDGIAGSRELFRMGVWQFSRTSKVLPSWSVRKKS
jgi:hypothetical protein